MNNTNENRPNAPTVRRDPLAEGSRSRSASPEYRPSHSSHPSRNPEDMRSTRSAAPHHSHNQEPHPHRTQPSNPQPHHRKPEPAPQKSSVIPYIFICILSVMVVFMGVVTFLSLFRLNQMSEKLLLLQDSMDDIESDIDAVTEQAEELTALNTQYEELAVSNVSTSDGELQGPLLSSDTEADEKPEPETVVQEEEQGTLTPSSDTASALDDPSYDSFLNETVLPSVENKLPTNNGKWSVYVNNLSLDSSGTINNGKMKAASLIKLYIMGAVYEQYDQLISLYDEGELSDHLYQMITVSDNDSANTLVRWLGNGDAASGRGVVNDFCSRHGFTDSFMGRMLLEENPSGENYTSVKDCGEFLREIYLVCTGQSSPVQLTHCSDMYRLLQQQQRRNKIPLRIPEGVGVANKTGELLDVENDAAIIYNTEKGNDLVIVFMSENLTDCGSAQQTISNLSNAIYGAYNEDLV